ncbi:MAG: hypothetical protein P8Z35_02575 [Ignavibacteriaceae bacterium]|jgi:hypothetical protein
MGLQLNYIFVTHKKIHFMKLNTFILILFTVINIFAQSKYYSLSLVENKANYNIAYQKSFNNFNLSDKTESHKYSIINLSGQTIVGSALAAGFSIPPLIMAWADSWNHSTDASQTALGIISISAYLLGAATGVYWVAKSENSKLSYWGTVGYSVIGGGISTVIASILASQYLTVPTAGVLIIGLCPVASSMIYASFISEWPGENKNLSFSNEVLTYKDLINYTNIFKIELIHINL